VGATLPDDPDDFALFASLLHQPGDGKPAGAENDNDDAMRETCILLLRLFYGHAHSQLKGLQEEYELLIQERSSVQHGQERQGFEDDAWRLDPPNSLHGIDGTGPLMDSSGRVRRLNPPSLLLYL
jgi:immunoglobulin-binding protein 1